MPTLFNIVSALSNLSSTSVGCLRAGQHLSWPKRSDPRAYFLVWGVLLCFSYRQCLLYFKKWLQVGNPLLHPSSIQDREWRIWKSMAIQEKGEERASHMFMPNGGANWPCWIRILPSGENANSFQRRKKSSLLTFIVCFGTSRYFPLKEMMNLYFHFSSS